MAARGARCPAALCGRRHTSTTWRQRLACTALCSLQRSPGHARLSTTRNPVIPSAGASPAGTPAFGTASLRPCGGARGSADAAWPGSSSLYSTTSRRPARRANTPTRSPGCALATTRAPAGRARVRRQGLNVAHTAVAAHGAGAVGGCEQQGAPNHSLPPCAGCSAQAAPGACSASALI
jgi:hypothetical protein